MMHTTELHKIPLYRILSGPFRRHDVSFDCPSSKMDETPQGEGLLDDPQPDSDDPFCKKTAKKRQLDFDA